MSSAPSAAAAPAGSPWIRAMPGVFVVIWSTGFVVARYAMPHSPPMTFLAGRFLLSIVAFGLWIAFTRPAWPRNGSQWLHLSVTGVLMHTGYLGGVWAAIRTGAPAGTVALITGLQPMLTALWLSASDREHRVTPRQWAGLLLGLAGLTLVVWRKIGVGEMNAFNVGLSLLGLLSVTVGTLWQKRFVAPCDVRTANTVQLLAAFAVAAPLSLFETAPVELHPELFGAMAFSVLVMTLGGSSLLFMLIQRGAATQVTSLFYLVPPCTALFAWLLFDESLSASVVIGIALTAFGVWLVVRTPPSS